MFIIWGWRVWETNIGSGHFDCPVCLGQQPYTQFSAARYFVLYFILPLFKTADLGEFVRCDTCRQVFENRVLYLTSASAQPAASRRRRRGRRQLPDHASTAGAPTPQYEELLQQTREELELGTSVQEVEKLLRDMGVANALVGQLIATALGGQLGQCLKCNLDFAPTVAQCSQCGQGLQQLVAVASADQGASLPDDELLEQVREELEMGTSIQEAKTLLMKMGTAEEVAFKLVGAAAGRRQKQCAACNVSYVDTVQRCGQCGQGL